MEVQQNCIVLYYIQDISSSYMLLLL